MVDQNYAQRYFRQSMFSYLDVKGCSIYFNFLQRLIKIKDEQVAVITPLGWYTSSTFLEQVAMTMSEVYEVYTADTSENRNLELIDILLRVFVLCDRLNTQVPNSIMTFEKVLANNNPIDNRFKEINHSYRDFDFNSWLLCIYNKLGSCVNCLRGTDVTLEQQLELTSSLNQVVYMTIITFLHADGRNSDQIQPSDLEHVCFYLNKKVSINKDKLAAKSKRHK